MPKQLSASDQDLLGQMCGFAEREAENGVYMNYMVSRSRNNQRFIVIVAMGDQADAVQKIVLDAQVPREGAIEVVSEAQLKAMESGW